MSIMSHYIKVLCGLLLCSALVVAGGHEGLEETEDAPQADVVSVEGDEYAHGRSEPHGGSSSGGTYYAASYEEPSDHGVQAYKGFAYSQVNVYKPKTPSVPVFKHDPSPPSHHHQEFENPPKFSHNLHTDLPKFSSGGHTDIPKFSSHHQVDFPKFPSNSGSFPSHSGGFPSHSGGFPSHSGGFPSHGGFSKFSSHGDFSKFNHHHVDLPKFDSNLDFHKFGPSSFGSSIPKFSHSSSFDSHKFGHNVDFPNKFDSGISKFNSHLPSKLGSSLPHSFSGGSHVHNPKFEALGAGEFDSSHNFDVGASQHYHSNAERPEGVSYHQPQTAPQSEHHDDGPKYVASPVDEGEQYDESEGSQYDASEQDSPQYDNEEDSPQYESSHDDTPAAPQKGGKVSYENNSPRGSARHQPSKSSSPQYDAPKTSTHEYDAPTTSPHHYEAPKKNKIAQYLPRLRPSQHEGAYQHTAAAAPQPQHAPVPHPPPQVLDTGDKAVSYSNFSLQ